MMMHTRCADSAIDWADESGRFAIDPETGIAFGEFAGEVRPGNLLAALATTARYRGARSGLCALADLRDATVLWNASEELTFRRALYAHFPSRIRGRCALLAPRCVAASDDPAQPAAEHAGTETLLENLYLRVDARLFRDFGQAMRWLLLPDEARRGGNEQADAMNAGRGMRQSCRIGTTATHCG
jgi:hypothetical protein